MRKAMRMIIFLSLLVQSWASFVSYSHIPTHKINLIFACRISVDLVRGDRQTNTITK